MKSSLSNVLDAYLDACKERSKWTMKLSKLRNPGAKALEGRSQFKKTLNELFGPTEGPRAWAKFMRSLRKEQLHAKSEHAYYKAKARRLCVVLRYLRKSHRN